MYWGRKYYLVSFDWHSYNMRINNLKLIPSVKILPSYKKGMIIIDDQLCTTEKRKTYQMLISCNLEDGNAVEYELKKAERNDDWCGWEEIKRNMSKKYFDINGNEVPYRRCDLNPMKRCNHCMDC